MNTSRYRYTVALDNGAGRELAPLGNGRKIEGKREGQNIFFRRKLSGSLTLVGDDYAFFYELENSNNRCGHVRLLIERECNGIFTPYWKGIFTMTDCKFNYDTCQLVVSPEPDDAYRIILENYSREFNILHVPRAPYNIKTRIDLNNVFQFKQITGDAIGQEVDAETWALFLRARNWIDGSISGLQLGTREHNDIIFRLTRTAAYASVGGVFVAPDLSNDGWKIIARDNVAKIATYAKAPVIYGFKPYEYKTKADWFDKYPELQQKQPGESWDMVNFISVSGTTQANSSGDCGNEFLNFRYYVDETRCRRLIWEKGAFYFNRGRRLIDAVSYLVAQTAPASVAASPEAQSLFFTEATNYVTKQANDLLDLLIFQKTDVLDYNGSEPATKGEISLKSITDDLRDQFQVYWFLDDAGKFRMEHLSYFQAQGVYDLTTRADWKRYLVGTRAYEYNKSSMPQFERLLFTEALGDDFLKSEIEYTDPCVNKQIGQNIKETTVSRFSNDLKALVTGGSGSNTGFVLIAHRNGEVIRATGGRTGTIQTNAPLAAANLVSAYWRHSRVLLSGKLDGSYTTFATTAKNRKQNAITVPACCETVKPYANHITTLSANGELESWTEELEPGKITFVVLHSAPAETTGGPARSFDDSFNESAG